MGKWVSWVWEGDVALVFSQKRLPGQQVVEAVKEPATLDAHGLIVWQKVNDGLEECIGFGSQTKEFPLVRMHSLPSWEVILEDGLVK